MRKLSITRPRGGIKEEEFVKLISIDEYEYPIETKIIRRHSTIIATLLSDYGSCTTKQDVQIIPPSPASPSTSNGGSEASHSNSSSPTQPTTADTTSNSHSVFEHDHDPVDTHSTVSLSSAARKIRHKCTPLALQRSSFSGRSNSSVYSHKNTSTGSIMQRSSSSPAPPLTQTLDGDSPPSFAYTYPHALPTSKRHMRHSTPRMQGFGQSLAAGSHEIVNKMVMHQGHQSTALPGLAEAMEPHAQNTKGALKPSPYVRSTWSDNSGLNPASNPFAVPNAQSISPEPLSSAVNCSRHKPSLASIGSQMSDSELPRDGRIRYSKSKSKIWLSEDAVTVEAWTSVMKGVSNGYTPTESLSRTSPELIAKLLACVKKYDDRPTLTFVEEYLTDFTTPLNSLRHLLLAKRYNMPSLHGAAVVKVPPHVLPLLSIDQINEIGAEDMKIMLNSTYTLNLLQLLEFKRLFISPSMMTTLKESTCMSFKLCIHNEEYLTIDVREYADSAI